MAKVPCACGCGEMHDGIDSRGRSKKFVRRGHNLRERDNYMLQPGAISPMKGKNLTPEHKAKISTARLGKEMPNLRGSKNGMYGRVGSLNPRYKGGGSPERQKAYASSEWREVVRVVRTRDGSRCQKCRESKIAESLHLHHKKSWAEYPDLRLDPDNIVTLCIDCHRDEHRKGVCHQQGAIHQ